MLCVCDQWRNKHGAGLLPQLCRILRRSKKKETSKEKKRKTKKIKHGEHLEEVKKSKEIRRIEEKVRNRISRVHLTSLSHSLADVCIIHHFDIEQTRSGYQEPHLRELCHIQRKINDKHLSRSRMVVFTQQSEFPQCRSLSIAMFGIFYFVREHTHSSLVELE